MKHGVSRQMVRVMVATASLMAVAGSVWAAEESTRALPTLLIKGEVVSVDANDPSATLLKVKDRYGFETPIYLTQETKIGQGDKPMTVANLSAGMNVEVEYNFDINTAKRHAVSVVPSAAASTPAAPAPAAVSAPAATSMTSSASAPVSVQTPTAAVPATQAVSTPATTAAPASTAAPAASMSAPAAAPSSATSTPSGSETE